MSDNKLLTSVKESLITLSTDVRNLLQKEWEDNGDSNISAKLTAIMSEEIFGLDTAQHKEHKKLSDNDDLRNNMSRKELGFLILGELFAAYLIKRKNITNSADLEKYSRQGARLAKDVLDEFEKISETKVLTDKNRKS